MRNASHKLENGAIMAFALACAMAITSTFFPNTARGDGLGGNSTDIPYTGSSQGKEFPQSVGVYVYVEGFSSNTGLVKLDARLKSGVGLQEGGTRETSIALTGTTAQLGERVLSSAAVYLPIRTEQEIAYSVESSSLSNFKVHVQTPAGYDVYFYNENLKYYEQSAAYEYNGNSSNVLFIVKRVGEQGLPAGKALDIMPGDSTLRMGLGYLPNGKSAGYLDFSPMDRNEFELGLLGGILAPFYCFPTDTSVKLVFEDVTTTGGQTRRQLRQVLTPQALVDIVQKSDGTQYTVDFYARATVTFDGNKYVPSGQPFVSYLFATKYQSWDSHTCITRTEGNLTQEASFTVNSGQQNIDVPYQECYPVPYWDCVDIDVPLCVPTEEEVCETVTEMEPVYEEEYPDSSQGEDDPDEEPRLKVIDEIPVEHEECHSEPGPDDCFGVPDWYCYEGYDVDCYSATMTYPVQLPRKSIEIVGFNGKRTEYRASCYDDPNKMIEGTNFDGDSYQIVSTGSSKRMVGRYGAEKIDGAPAHVSAQEVGYQFTQDVGALSSFLPDLPKGNYGYRTDRQYYDIDFDPNMLYEPSYAYPGRIYWEENPDRSWTMFDYFTDTVRRGLVNKVVLPFGDTERPYELPTITDAGYCIKTIDYAADWDGAVRLPAVEENWVNGVLISKTEHTHQAAGTANGQPVWQTTTRMWAQSTASLVQTSIAKVYQGKDMDPAYRGQPYSIQAADDTKTVFAYDRGTVDTMGNFTVSDTGNAFRSINVTGLASAASGVTSLDGTEQIVDAVALVSGLSMRVETIYNSGGFVVRVNKFIYADGTWNSLEWERRIYDIAGNLLHVESSNGTSMDYEYTDFNGDNTSYNSISFANSGVPTGRLQYSRDANGAITKYTYGDFGRVTETLRLAVPASGTQSGIAELRTAFTYDSDGRVTSKVIGPGTGEKLTFTYTYDFAGLPASKTEQGFTTRYSYGTSDGKIFSTTETNADGSYVTATKNRDGSIQSKTGNATVPEYYEYTVEGANLAVKTSFGAVNSPRWIKQWKDGLGHLTKEQAPTASGTSTTEYVYNNKGQLVSKQSSGLAAVAYSYDAFGRVSDATTADRHESYLSDYRQRDGAWWKYQETSVHPDANTSVATKKTWTRVTGHSNAAVPSNAALSLAGSIVSESIAQDVAGNEARSLVLVDRATARRFAVAVNPLASCAAVELYLGGLPIKSASSSGVTKEIVYDGLYRPIRQLDRTSAGSTTPQNFTYIAGSTLPYESYDDLNHLVARNTYDSVGRVIAVATPLVTYTAAGVPAEYSASSITNTYYHYNTRGQITNTWGDATNPVKVEYNTYGDLTAQRTYRAFTGVGAATSTSGGDPANWPGVSAADTTTFTRNEQDGSFASRTDAKGKTTSYTYNIRGQVATITSPRGITTTNTYDGDTGELLAVSHSDGTPGTSYTYDNLGRVVTVHDATGYRTFTYRPGDLRLDSEKLGMNGGAGDFQSVYGTDLVFEQAYGALAGTYAASVNLGMDLKSGSNVHYGWRYNVDSATGRPSSFNTDTGSYNLSYLANSDMVQYVANGAWGQGRTFEANSNLVASMNTVSGVAEVSRQNYKHDALGRRYQVAQTGLVYQPYLNGQQKMVAEYAYDSRSQLTASRMRVGNPDDMTNAVDVPGRNFAYAYDTMGNRISETINGTTHNYQTNELNQYTGRTTPATVPVSGMASSDATVTVNGSALATNEFLNNYFYRDIAKNPSGGGLQSIDISASVTGWSQTQTLQTSVRPTAETFVHDNDGNLISDGLWDYSYDAYNQLVQMVSKQPDQTGKRALLRFVYDYKGRRVSKRVYDADTTSGIIVPGQLRSERLFVYEGWLLAAEYEIDPSTHSRSLMRTYTWGPDLGGGDGISGLLAIKDYRTSYEGVYHTAFDGNGNLVALVRQDTGALAAAYEYDGFGNLLRSSGEYAAENPFRFSTKYQDRETSLLYYGLRYYSPSMGRFINRDPIGESGGINLYAAAANNLVNGLDYLGMWGDDDEIIELPPMVVTSGSCGYSDSFGSWDFSFNMLENGQINFWWSGSGAYSLSNLSIKSMRLPDGTMAASISMTVNGLMQLNSDLSRGLVEQSLNITFTATTNNQTNTQTAQVAEANLPVSQPPSPVAAATQQSTPQMSTSERVGAAVSGVINLVGAFASAAAAGASSPTGAGAILFGLLAAKLADNAVAELMSAATGQRQETLFNSLLKQTPIPEKAIPYVNAGVEAGLGGAAAGLAKQTVMTVGTTFIRRQAATAEGLLASEGTAAKTTATQLEFPFARGASVQTPGVTKAGETFVRVGASPQSLKFGSTSLSGVQPGTYAFPKATFKAIGQNPAALKNLGDLPGAAPQYFRILRPPPGTPIQRGLVPGGQYGGVGGVEEVIFPKGF